MGRVAFYDFRELFSKNVASVMVAHLYIPSLDTTKNQASTLSKYIVSDLLKQQMQFKGLVFTDALNMKGASKYNAPGVVDAKALVAGNDVLLFSENVPVAIEEIKKAIAKGEITQEEVDARCKKILKAKYWCGLNKKQFVREISCAVKIQEGKSFGFMDDVFIHPSLITKYQLKDGMQFTGTVIKSFHKEKKQWGWKLI
jgi:beta-glucosidase-like glycosyl hydrolase